MKTRIKKETVLSETKEYTFPIYYVQYKNFFSPWQTVYPGHFTMASARKGVEVFIENLKPEYTYYP
jgi:hypothetical protein